MSTQQPGLGWLGIFRVGLVNMSLGSIVIQPFTTFNQAMTQDLALMAMLPGFLGAIYYLIQLSRPRIGHALDSGRRKTPWMVGGIGVLALGGITGAGAIVVMESHTAIGIAIAVFGYFLIGVGSSTTGTALLAFLANRIQPQLRSVAAMVVWPMMIIGFAVTGGVVGALLDPFSTERLFVIVAVVSLIAFTLTNLALFRLEGPGTVPGETNDPEDAGRTQSFRTALKEAWQDDKSRRFTVFVLASMLAYNAHEAIIEPFARQAFDLTAGQATQLGGMYLYLGVLCGMFIAGVSGRLFRGWLGSLWLWAIGGCFASGGALAALGIGSFLNELWPLKPSVFFLGLANGAFTVAAIGLMMRLANESGEGRSGIRIGLWGAAQAIAFGVGIFLGTAGVDAFRYLLNMPTAGYNLVFTLAAVLFLIAGWLAFRVFQLDRPSLSPSVITPTAVDTETRTGSSLR
ncbi:MAG: BCD family MFS transporter [Halorhodospira sp.]